MSKCFVCKRERDLTTLRMTHLEEEYGEEPINYKVCGTCWEVIFEIALVAANHVIDGKARKEETARKKLISDLPEETVNAAKEITWALRKLFNDSKNLSCSMEGKTYLFMHQIREKVNEKLRKKNQVLLSPQAVGSIIRDHLHLEVGKRQGKGVPVYVSDKKIKLLFEYILKREVSM